MDNWITWVIQAAIMLLIGGLGFFLKRTLTQLEEKITTQEKRLDEKIVKDEDRVEKLEDKLNGLINSLPLHYTLRDDFIRIVAGLENKLDKILERLSART